MNTTITIRTNAKLKKDAKAIAQELGFSLSSVLNAYLKKLVKTKTVNFSLEEKPSPYLIKLIKEAEKDLKEGKTISFSNPSEAEKYINDLAN